MSKWLTAPDIAADLGFHAKTIRVWCAKGVFPGAEKFPNNSKTAHWRIPASDLEALKRKQTSHEAPSNDRLDELMNAALAGANGSVRRTS